MSGEAPPYWPRLAGVFLLSMLATPLALLLPVPLKTLIDNAIGPRALPWFLAAVLPASAAHSRSALLVAAAGLVVVVALLNQLRDLANWVLERESLYWGTPRDDEEAIRELERMRRSGSSFSVFSWLSFW